VVGAAGGCCMLSDQPSTGYRHRRSRRTKSRILGGLVATCAGWLAATAPAQAQTGSSNSQFYSPFREEIAEELLQRSVAATALAPQKYMREVFWGFSDDTPAFFRDSLMQVVARSYYLTRDNFDGSKSQAWAGGGWLAYRSGLIADIFGVHAAVYTSQPIYAPLDQGGTRLLNPEQEQLTMLGQAYGRVKIFDQEIRGGRQLVDTPLMNPQDNRMVPTTFEGAQLVTLPDPKRSYDYAVGYMWNVKQRDSNDFIALSDALAGGDVINRGAPFGMVKYRPLPGVSTIVAAYQVQDFVNTEFGQVEYAFQLPKEVPQWIVGANVIGQQSDGTNLLTGAPFQTFQASARVQMTHMGWILFAAGSITGDESKMFSPFGTKPNYTDMQQVSFDNANEKAIGGSVAYDFGYAFSNLGLSGLTAGVWYTHGWDAINPATNTGIPNRDELDLWIQYRPSSGLLKGLRLKTQYSNLRQEGNVRTNQPEFRMIADYTVLFR
jgi:hypothetical protein